MDTNRMSRLGLMAAAMVFSASALAGEALVQWNNPEKYTDIRSGDQSAEGMRKSIAKSLGGEFSGLASQLPPGYRLSITVTDLDLAGEVDPVELRQMHQIRVLKDIYFPRMVFDYRLTDPAGDVLLEQSGVVLNDMQYMSSMRTTRSGESFHSERKMIRDWFNERILPNVK
jgi:hypothetical protein